MNLQNLTPSVALAEEGKAK